MCATVEGGVDTQIAAELDAGVGAGDVEELRAVGGADLHVFDRFRLDRQVGRLCAADGQQACGRAEDEVAKRSQSSLLKPRACTCMRCLT
jgi:hypothetical protein